MAAAAQQRSIWSATAALSSALLKVLPASAFS
jgi:hypothetical protein